MNFTDPQFYGGVIASIMLIIGGFIGWILARKNSKLAGIDICYGISNIFPWVFASQVLSAGLAIFVFRYINLFDTMQVAWVATFVSIVGAPPSVMLLYGPGIKQLLTGSILGGLLAAPVATWLFNYITQPLGMPGVASNVFAMTITGVLICGICKVLPWIKKREVIDHRKKTKPGEDVYSAKWLVRRCIADFSEAQFWATEIASIFLFVGLIVEWMISTNLVAGGSGMIPAIVLSQFIGTGVGVFLYASKFDNGGWYGTYIPVVSVGPACVLMFGGGIHIAVIAGVLGGILGPPLGEFLQSKCPDGIHPTNAYVAAMGICSTVVASTIRFLGF